MENFLNKPQVKDLSVATANNFYCFFHTC